MRKRYSPSWNTKGAIVGGRRERVPTFSFVGIYWVIQGTFDTLLWAFWLPWPWPGSADIAWGHKAQRLESHSQISKQHTHMYELRSACFLERAVSSLLENGALLILRWAEFESTARRWILQYVLQKGPFIIRFWKENYTVKSQRELRLTFMTCADDLTYVFYCLHRLLFF